MNLKIQIIDKVVINIARKIIFVFLFLLIITVTNVNAFKANSSNFILFPTIVSSGGEIINSSNFKSYIATDIIAGVVNSSNFKNLLGFFYTWLLADGQPCTTNNQCQGGFCCSNLCQSTSCPVAGGAAPAGGAGPAAAAGGGAGLPVQKEDFSLSETAIKEQLVLGEEKSETLAIINTGDTNLDFSLSIEGEIKEFLSLSDSSFSLSEGESKTINFDFIAKRVGSFTGKVTVKGKDIEKSVAISFEVESEISLFDVKLDIPTDYKRVHPGEELRAQITLLNVGAPELVDVIATYIIKDLNGNIVYQSSETFAVEIQKSFVKDFPIAKNLKLGIYVAIIELRYANSFAVSSEFFEIVEPEVEKIKQIVISKLFIILIVLILIGMLSLFILNLIPKGRLFKREK